ncbi:hypothetical protein BU15DRAFT_80834 [Melanogaster broomeanus]|nr:hypothetical protein BU15DRAFT_80834 [Melanogaster broomeanus]
MPALDRPLTNAKFTLDVSGIAGFFGGQEALAAITTIHLFKGKRWLGWYNMPGSYLLSRTIGQLANSGVWDRLFPRPDDSGFGLAESSFGLDGKPGPKYVASMSQTVIDTTGHLGYVIMTGSKTVPVEEIEGRRTIPSEVAFLDLRGIRGSRPAILQEDACQALLALIPISTSFITCILCAIYGDWFCFAMILLGIISGGVTSFVIGSAKLSISRVRSMASHPGDGLLIEANTIVVVRGEESAVSTITRGRFVLELMGSSHYNRIGMCSLLLITQFLQLLIIPQGSLFGQIMFVISLAVSWIYSYYLSSFPKEDIQLKWLLDFLGNPEMHRFRLQTRTAMTVFTCLLLREGIESDSAPLDAYRILRDFVPRDTPVWERWRHKVVQQLESEEYESLHALQVHPHDTVGFAQQDIMLLEALLRDAMSAFRGYERWHASL